MRFCDAHNHLHDSRFGGRQATLVREARAMGVTRMVVNGSCEADWPQVEALSQQFPGFVLPAFGLHPWYVHECSREWRARLCGFLDRNPGAGLGEIGLDRWILDCPPAARAAVGPGLDTIEAASIEEQAVVFDAQLCLAAERNLPVSIHCLQAWGRLFDRLRTGPRPERGFLLHSYGGPEEMVAPLARLGAYFGFPGYFLRARKARQREAFRSVPMDRVLAETDAPDQLLPGPTEGIGSGDLPALGAHEATVVSQPNDRLRPAERGQASPLELADAAGRPLNHPGNLGLVYAGLAKVLELAPDHLEQRIAENFDRLFGPLRNHSGSISQ